MVREYEMLTEPALTVLSDTRCGVPGQTGRNTPVRADGSMEPLPGNLSQTLRAGDRLRIESPGGGGSGGAAQDAS